MIDLTELAELVRREGIDIRNIMATHRLFARTRLSVARVSRRDRRAVESASAL
jgi:hypothetical protein